MQIDQVLFMLYFTCANAMIFLKQADLFFL